MIQTADPYIEHWEQTRGHVDQYERTEWCRAFSWAIPTPPALAAIAEWSPLVDPCAGTGYWAGLLTELGSDVVAFDHEETNVWHYRARHYPVQLGDAPTVAAEYPERTLLLVWPPYDSEIAYETARAHLDAGGSRLVYIGEPRGCCTGDDAFFNLLAWEYTAADHYQLPQWDMASDSMTRYVR